MYIASSVGNSLQQGKMALEISETAITATRPEHCR